MLLDIFFLFWLFWLFSKFWMKRLWWFLADSEPTPDLCIGFLGRVLTLIKDAFGHFFAQLQLLKLQHIVRNSFWIKKNQESDNEGKFHIYLKCRIWICNKEFNFSLDIRITMNLAFFLENWTIFGSFWAVLYCYKTE